MGDTTLLSAAEGFGDQPVGLPIDWSAALARHDRWLRTVVLARLGEPPAVDEVMQEIALAAVGQQQPLHDPARVGAWLYRVAIRQVLLYRRRHGRQRRLLQGFAQTQTDHSELTASADPLHWLLLDERKALIRTALARLPQRDAEILLLKYTEDWSYRELAAHLGLSESAVEARLHRARQRLRTAILDNQVLEKPE
jgi:RNA polymerase sigma-70 factor (ECF subfamily)